MIKIFELEQFLKTLLKPELFDDYCPNGLQIEGRENIKKILFSVSATRESTEYAAKIKALEVENNILRNEIMKAGIKIPLSTYTGAIVSTGTTTKTGSTSNSTNTIYQNALAPNVSAITSTYGTRYANFVTKIHTDWSAIRTAYKMPETAFIGGYEFVKQ